MAETEIPETKLSKAQRELLVSANGPGGTPCVKYYAPAVKLVNLGLAQWGFSSAYGTDKLCITDAGRAALGVSP